ncbi:MAG: hypothetical protein QHH19_03390 [Candidatus Thermoplasmatota archaeon]|jgi:hypothetical protein|nr:hypothetical protein [Candidatus Thermoplasmatota archaeon]
MKENKSMGFISLLCGITGIILLPLDFYFSAYNMIWREHHNYIVLLIGVLGIIAIVTGKMAYSNINKDKKDLIGIILGIIDIAFAILWIIVYWYVINLPTSGYPL